MHLEATAVLFGAKLRDLGGKLSSGKQVDQREAILAPFWGQVWPVCGRC